MHWAYHVGELEEGLVHRQEKSFIAVHVYCTLVVVAHSTGTICVALYAVSCNTLTLQCKYIAAEHGGVDENGIVGFG